MRNIAFLRGYCAQAENAVSMRIKDAMRDSCIGLVVDSIRELVVTYQVRKLIRKGETRAEELVFNYE